jgi:hypothetical protein
MNCQSCNTTIDYRFLTNCAHCETEQTSLSPGIVIEAPVASQNHAPWTRRVINFLYILVSSGAAMISGAVVLYFSVGITCAAFMSSTGNPSADCARGNAIAGLSLLTGGFLGTVVGSIFAVKNPLCKN